MEKHLLEAKQTEHCLFKYKKTVFILRQNIGASRITAIRIEFKRYPNTRTPLIKATKSMLKYVYIQISCLASAHIRYMFQLHLNLWLKYDINAGYCPLTG